MKKDVIIINIIISFFIGGNKIDNVEYKIWISLIKDLGIKRYQKLIHTFGSKEQLWNAKEGQLLGVEGIGKVLAKTISNIQIKCQIMEI